MDSRKTTTMVLVGGLLIAPVRVSNYSTMFVINQKAKNIVAGAKKVNQMKVKNKCKGNVWSTGVYLLRCCTNQGKVERNGSWYCGIHDPVAVNEKLAARNKKNAESK